MTRWHASTAAALLGGLAVAAAFPPLGWWGLAPAGVALLSLAARGRSLGGGLWAGLVFGLAMFTPLLHFLDTAMGNPLGWVALSVWEALNLAVLGGAWALVSRLPRLVEGRWAVTSSVLSLGVLWAGVEEMRSSVPLGGFPFGRLAFAVADSPALPVAAYGGSVGLSLVVAMVGAALAEVVARARRGDVLRSLAAAVGAGALLVAPVALPSVSRAEAGTMRVAAVQGNVAEDFLDAFGRALEVTDNHVEATEQLAADVGHGGVDLVVWPENAADLDPRDHEESAVLVERAAQAVGAPLLVGAVRYAPDGPGGATVRYNDSVLWLPGTGPVGHYRKHLPVPFGEYVPWRSTLRRLTDQVDRVGTDLLPGTGPHTLTVHAASQGRDVPLALGICFEVAYDSVLREGVLEGGELLVVPTNNASFLHSSEAAQQLAQGRVQAVVHGRAVVQASTVGITAVIGPDGVVRQQTLPFTQASLVADVPLRTSVTPADRLGPWTGRALEAVSCVLAAAGILAAVRASRARRSARRR